MSRLILAAVLSGCGWHAPAAAEAVPGGVVDLYLPDSGLDPPSVFYGNRQVLVRRIDDRWQALVAIDLDTAPGDYVVRIEATNQDPVHQTLTVRPHREPRVVRPATAGSASADDSGYPPPPPPPPPVHWRAELDATLPLSYPIYRSVLLAGDRRYGTRRLMANGSYHWDVGLEFKIRNNSRVNAPGAGTVSYVLSAGRQAFAVYVDHGMGLVSGVYPVTDVKVAPGNQVTRGALLGRIYNPVADGPVIITWTLRMNGAYVDPVLFSEDAGATTVTGD